MARCKREMCQIRSGDTEFFSFSMKDYLARARARGGPGATRGSNRAFDVINQPIIKRDHRRSGGGNKHGLIHFVYSLYGSGKKGRSLSNLIWRMIP